MTTFCRFVVLVLLLTFISYNKVSAQSNDLTAQEEKFALLYSELLQSSHHSFDTTAIYAEKFSKEFAKFIEANPATLNYPFKKIVDSNYLQIRTSTDGAFRIYTWDTWMGGTMHEFATIYQWRSGGQVFTTVPKADIDNPGAFVSQILTVIITNKPHYLAITNAIYSTKDARQSIAAFTITNGNLVDTVRLFKTKTRSVNKIDVDFDFFSVADRPERPLRLIDYDADKKLIYIPVVSENGEVSKRNIVYKLKGSHFEFVGIEVGNRKQGLP